MRRLLGKISYTLISVVIPLAIIVANAFLNFGGILLTIGLVVWIGFSLVIFSTLLEQ